MLTTTSTVWKTKDHIPWHFVTIENTDADELKRYYSGPKRGFGAIPVEVALGGSVWNTSIFPQKDGSYLLPLKKNIRTAEDIKAGDQIKFFISVSV